MQLLFHPNSFHLNNLQFLQTSRESKSSYFAGEGGEAGIGDTIPFLLSTWFLVGVCPAIAAVGSMYRADTTHLPGRQCGKHQPWQIG